FSANTLAELAAAIKNPYQARAMDGATLQATVARYNTFVDTGTDVDFGKPRPQFKIQTPPFYAAWATPLVHDTRAGLRINARRQVMDMQGQVVPRLDCGGGSARGVHAARSGPRRRPGVHRRDIRRRRATIGVSGIPFCMAPQYDLELTAS